MNEWNGVLDHNHSQSGENFDFRTFVLIFFILNETLATEQKQKKNDETLTITI